MMAIIGMIIHDGITESGRGDCALNSACPLRAFEKEFGVQGPVGFCGLLAPRLMKTPRTSPAAPRQSWNMAAYPWLPPLATLPRISPETAWLLGSFSWLNFGDILNGLPPSPKVPATG